MIFGTTYKQDREKKQKWINKWNGKTVDCFAWISVWLDNGKWVWLETYRVRYFWGAVSKKMHKTRYLEGEE